MSRPVQLPLKVAIIGLGGVAQAHLQAFELLPETITLVAVCDVQAEVASAIAAKFKAQDFTDYRQLLDSVEVDLVMVLTPASTHREIVEAIAKAGRQVFCEKPIAVTMEDAEAMVETCAEAQVRLFYGSSYRYLPAVIKAKALIQAGAVGQVQLLTEQLMGGQGIEGYQQLPPIHYPLGGPGGPGMGMVDHGVHLIDIFPWITGSKIVSATGSGQRSGEPASTEYMVMQLANGAVGHLLYNAATFSTSLPNEGMFSGGQGWLTDGTITETGMWETEPGSISIYGTTGSLRLFHYTNALFINTGTGPVKVPLTGRPAFGHFASQLEDIADLLVTEGEPRISGQDGIDALVALLAIYE